MGDSMLEECVKAVLENEVTKSKMATGTLYICGETYRVKVIHNTDGNEILRVYSKDGTRIFMYIGQITGRLLTYKEIEAEFEKRKTNNRRMKE